METFWPCTANGAETKFPRTSSARKYKRVLMESFLNRERSPPPCRAARPPPQLSTATSPDPPLFAGSRNAQRSADLQIGAKDSLIQGNIQRSTFNSQRPGTAS